MLDSAASGETAAARAGEGPGLAVTALVLAAITIVRLVGLHFSIVDFDVDEVQYWGWSRELAFGYFSKPPLIAWWDAAAGLVCGDSIQCVRSPAPIAYFVAGLAAYGAGHRLYGRWAGLLAALLLVLAPGISFSSRLMTTDVPLLMFWTLALYAFVRLREGGRWPWAAMLGLCFGLGMLAKYAMIYFPIGIALAALVDPQSRALLRRPALWLWLVGGALLLLPNLAWNIGNGFITFIHTSHYVEPGKIDVSPVRPLVFVVTQFLIAGPVAFGVFLALVWRVAGRTLPASDRMLLAFAIPPLLVIFVESAFADFFANWAVTGFVSIFVLAAAWLARGRHPILIGVSFAVALFFQLAFLGMDAVADRVSLPFLHRPDIYAQYMGWARLGDEVRTLAADEKVAAIATDNRGAAATLIYYLGSDAAMVHAWPPAGLPDNHYQLTRPLTPDTPGPVLFLTTCATASPAALAPYYAEARELAPLNVVTGPNSSRTYRAFVLAGPKGRLGPVGDCPG
jgi:4-amino-4-deoxy-L-arabinose transferase-like glycosyltransferase